MKTVLVTGSTGFLGTYITRKFFEEGYNLKLIIRRSEHIRAKDKIFKIFPEGTKGGIKALSNRVEIIEGDISADNLGLSEQNYTRLAEIVDEVFHCAAATKFKDGPNNILARTNVFGSLEIARFCAMKKYKRLHYVSTAYVAGRRQGAFFEDELEKGQLFNNNYEQSKYEAERNIVDFTKRHRIPCTIYRPSIITGNSKTGATKKYDNIYVFAMELIRFNEYESRKNVKYKDSENMDGTRLPNTIRIPGDKHGTINLIPVDYAADSIFYLSGQKETINKTFHIVNPTPPTIEEVAEWLMTATGIYRIKITDVHEFHVLPLNTLEKHFLRKTIAFQPYMFGEAYFDITNTRNYLAGSGLECPLITQEVIDRIVRYAVKENGGKKERYKAHTSK